MHIGILTCHSSLNYGANLQLYATVFLLQRMGHEVFVYDNREYSDTPCRCFVEHYFTLTRPCRTDEEFREETVRLGIELILVGSDAVLWFMRKAKKGKGVYPNPFWLRWTEGLNVRRALLAASSMGIMFYRLGKKLRNDLRNDLARFDYISVRDQWTKNFMSWVGIQDVDLVFDPTSSLPSLLPPSAEGLPDALHNEKYLLFTFSYAERHERWFRQMTEIAHSAGFKTCHVAHPDRLCRIQSVDLSICEVLDPFQWLSLLANSGGYVGERFHPVVLSAFYSVPFIACDYYSHSGPLAVLNKRSKTRDFCKRIGAEHSVHSAGTFFGKVKPASILPALERMPTGNAGPQEFERCLAKAVGDTE